MFTLGWINATKMLVINRKNEGGTIMNFAEQMKEKAENAAKKIVFDSLQSKYEKIDEFINKKAENGKFSLVVQFRESNYEDDARIVTCEDYEKTYIRYGEEYCMIGGIPCELGLKMAASLCEKHYKAEGFKVEAFLDEEELYTPVGLEDYIENYAINIISWDNCNEEKNESSDNEQPQ